MTLEIRRDETGSSNSTLTRCTFCGAEIAEQESAIVHVRDCEKSPL